MTDLPCAECKGQCCSFPAFSRREFKTARKNHGIPAGSEVMDFGTGFTVITPNGDCGYLVEGRCSIYKDRPKTCRDYGVVPTLPCQFLYPEKVKSMVDVRLRMLGMSG